MHPRLVKEAFMGRKTRCNFAKVTFNQFKEGSKSLDLMIEGHNREKDLTWDNSNASLNLGPSVKELYLKIDRWISPHLTVIILQDILRHFTHLEMLTLKDMNMHKGLLVDGSLSIYLQSLQQMKLCSVGNILNFLQGPTVDLLPNNVHLSLETEVLLTSIEPLGLGNFPRVVSTVTLEDLKIVCQKYPSILTELIMVNSELTKDYTKILCCVLNAQMETLKLTKCSFIGDEALEVLSNSTLKLKTLVIDGCKPNVYDMSHVTTRGIHVIVNKMKTLENLSFSLRDKIRLDTDMFRTELLELSALSLMSYGEHHEYCTIHLNGKKFNASHLCKLDSPDLLANLAKGSPSLRELCLDLICEISDDDVLNICKSFPRLSVLKLNSVCDVTDQALLGSDYYKSEKSEEGDIRPSVDLHIREDEDQTVSSSDNSDHRSEGKEGANQDNELRELTTFQSGSHAITEPHSIKGGFSEETGITNCKEEVRLQGNDLCVLQEGMSPVNVPTQTRCENDLSDAATELPEALDQVQMQSSETESPPGESPAKRSLPVHSEENWPHPEYNEIESNGIINFTDESDSGPAVSQDLKFDHCLKHSNCNGSSRTTRKLADHKVLAKGSSLVNCNRESGADCLYNVTGHRGLRELQDLQTLNLVGCCELTDRGFALGVKFHKLTHLKLTHCDHLTDSGVAALVMNNPAVETFVLQFCKGLSDDSVRIALEGFKTLERLKFDNCSKLTSLCLMYVSLSTTLKDVWFGSCNIPVADIANLRETLTTVKYHDFDW